MNKVHEIGVGDGRSRIVKMTCIVVVGISGSTFFPPKIQPPLSTLATIDATVHVIIPVTIGTTINESGA